jgi:hypothetical protein
MLSLGRNPIRRVNEPDLTRLRGLPRAEAMRIAMIKYGWDAATAARKVDIEQGRYEDVMAEGTGQIPYPDADGIYATFWEDL